MRDRAERGKGLRRLLAGALLLLLFPVGAVAVPQGEQEEDRSADPTAGISRYNAKIRDQALYRKDGYLYADLRLTGAFIGEVRDRIDSGLEVTFKYTLEVLRKRGWWFDRRVVHREVLTRVVRDTLAGRYILSRDLDDEEVARTSTDDPAVMREWMTRLEGIPLLPVAEAGAREGEKEPRLTLRVRAKVRDDFILLFVPWDFETGWERLVLPLGEIPEAAAAEGEAEDAGGAGPAAGGTG